MGIESNTVGELIELEIKPKLVKVRIKLANYLMSI